MIDQGIMLLLTCDTGVTAHQAVEYANTRDIPVIITDHHYPAARAAARVRRRQLPASASRAPPESFMWCWLCL